jgi:hypothetical protein
MGAPPRAGSLLRGWFGRHGSGDAEALQVLLNRICRQETALACHLAERARALRFAPHRRSLEAVAERESENVHALVCEIGDKAALAAAASPACRPGGQTVTKLILDLEETEDLAALYRQASRLTPNMILRGKLEGLAAEEGRSSQTIRGILATMDSYVTDRQ